MLPLGGGICSGPSPRRHGWQEEQFLGSLWCWKAQEGAEASSACSGREEGAELRLCSAPEGTSPVGELRPQNCSPGQRWVSALDPRPR